MASRVATDGQIEGALRKHAGIKTLAAKELNLSRQAIHQRIDKSPHLQKVIHDVEEQVLDMCDGHIITGIQKGDGQMVRWFAERKGKKRGYGNKVEFDDDQVERIVASLGGSPEKYRAALLQLGHNPEETS